MISDIDLEEIKKYLPQYLSSTSASDLFSQLKEFPLNLSKMYSASNMYHNEVLQADIIDNIPIVNLPKTTVKNGKVLVLSNSCDNDHSNKRFFPLSISYVPIIQLEALLSLLKSKPEISEDQIRSFSDQIKKQEITNFLFLPKGTFFDEDLIALFDKTLNMSQSDFLQCADNNKILTMGNYGFYIFLLKLSIHFTRIKESVDRG